MALGISRTPLVVLILKSVESLRVERASPVALIISVRNPLRIVKIIFIHVHDQRMLILLLVDLFLIHKVFAAKYTKVEAPFASAAHTCGLHLELCLEFVESIIVDMLIALIQILTVVIVFAFHVVLVVIVIRFVVASTLLELLIAIELLLVTEIIQLSIASPVYLELSRGRSANRFLPIALVVAIVNLDVVDPLSEELSEVEKSVDSFLLLSGSRFNKHWFILFLLLLFDCSLKY